MTSTGAASRQPAESQADLVATTASAVRSPVTTMLTYLELLRDGAYGALPPESLGPLDVIAASARDVLRLHERAVMLSAIAAGRVAFHVQPVDVAELVQAAVLEVRSLVAERRHDLEVAVAPELPLVACDPVQIHWVIVELIANAARFTAVGGNLRLRVALDQQLDRVRFTVADNGLGMPAAAAEALLARLRGDGWRGDEGIGGGLGLAFASAVVRLHGQLLEVETTLGLGTSVWFTLPAAPGTGGTGGEGGI